MNINSVVVQDFGIYEGRQTLNPSIGRPITLVGGFNGRGKTTMLEAILLCLYGKRSPVFRKSGALYSAYLEGLIHRSKQDPKYSSSIEMSLTLEDQGVVLKIRRSWQVSSARVNEQFNVWVNGDLDAYLIENWDSYVEELIPVAIAELFFFDGERISALAESDETIESLQKAIRSLLGIEVVDRAIADLGLVLRRKLTSGIDGELAEQIEATKARYVEVEQDLVTVNGGIETTTQALTEAKEEVKRLEDAYYKAGGNIAENRQELTQERERLFEEKGERKSQIGILAGGALPLLMIRQKLNRLHDLVQTERQSTQAKEALPLLEGQGQLVLDSLAHDGVQNDIVERIQNLLSEHQDRLVKGSTDAAHFTLSTRGFLRMEEFLLHEMGDLETEARTAIEGYEAMQLKLEQVDLRLNVDVDFDAVIGFGQSLADARGKAVHHEKLLSELETTKSALEKALESLDQEITDACLELAKHETQLRHMKHAAESQKLMREYRVALAKRKIGTLATSIFEAFKPLAHKSLVQSVTIDPETLRIALHGANGEEIPKHKLSSGERQMFAVAILWGLGQVSRRNLPVVIDTPMGRLDSVHRLNFVTKYLPEASHQVIVFSTDTELTHDYLAPIRTHIGKEYLLQYDDTNECTSIEEGYFAIQEGINHDRQAS